MERSNVKKGLKINDNLTCPGCRNGYNIGELVKEASSKRYRNLYCPKCGYRLGELN